mmetsp:Transcript_20363/g.70551  ORF Transcript_20363/g.70551 Transcript_20363/m.70551 type:complete len:512 (-) Transcript_20363:152-1687(-)
MSRIPACPFGRDASMALPMPAMSSSMVAEAWLQSSGHQVYAAALGESISDPFMPLPGGATGGLQQQALVLESAERLLAWAESLTQMHDVWNSHRSAFISQWTLHQLTLQQIQVPFMAAREPLHHHPSSGRGAWRRRSPSRIRCRRCCSGGTSGSSHTFRKLGPMPSRACARRSGAWSARRRSSKRNEADASGCGAADWSARGSGWRRRRRGETSRGASRSAGTSSSWSGRVSARTAARLRWSWRGCAWPPSSSGSAAAASPTKIAPLLRRIPSPGCHDWQVVGRRTTRTTSTTMTTSRARAATRRTSPRKAGPRAAALAAAPARALVTLRAWNRASSQAAAAAARAAPAAISTGAVEAAGRHSRQQAAATTAAASGAAYAAAPGAVAPVSASASLREGATPAETQVRQRPALRPSRLLPTAPIPASPRSTAASAAAAAAAAAVPAKAVPMPAAGAAAEAAAAAVAAVSAAAALRAASRAAAAIAAPVPDAHPAGAEVAQEGRAPSWTSQSR